MEGEEAGQQKVGQGRQEDVPPVGPAVDRVHVPGDGVGAAEIVQGLVQGLLVGEAVLLELVDPLLEVALKLQGDLPVFLGSSLSLRVMARR